MGCNSCGKTIDIPFGKKKITIKQSILFDSIAGKIISGIFLSVMFLLPFINIMAILLLWFALFPKKKSKIKDDPKIDEANKNKNNT